ncbi:MAG: hypothetical protein SR3Q1_12375 [Quinella sp. 3Q1]|nr:hypothetical protein [Quinella sp. 3Q1]
MKETFCGFQFKKMVLSSLIMMITFSLSGTASFILAAQLFGDNAMAAVNLVTPLFYSNENFADNRGNWHVDSRK